MIYAVTVIHSAVAKFAANCTRFRKLKIYDIIKLITLLKRTVDIIFGNLRK